MRVDAFVFCRVLKEGKIVQELMFAACGELITPFGGCVLPEDASMAPAVYVGCKGIIQPARPCLPPLSHCRHHWEAGMVVRGRLVDLVSRLRGMTDRELTLVVELLEVVARNAGRPGRAGARRRRYPVDDDA